MKGKVRLVRTDCVILSCFLRKAIKKQGNAEKRFNFQSEGKIILIVKKFSSCRLQISLSRPFKWLGLFSDLCQN